MDNTYTELSLSTTELMIQYYCQCLVLRKYFAKTISLFEGGNFKEPLEMLNPFQHIHNLILWNFEYFCTFSPSWL